MIKIAPKWMAKEMILLSMDKTLPYYGVIMLKDDLTDYPIYTLPEGYSFSIYEPGNEEKWAEIEASVGEFKCEKDALDYFEEEFAPHIQEFKRRCVFLRDEGGEFVGTTTGWYGNLLSEEDMPRIHWVAIKPEHQGKGLAKALLTKSFDILKEIHCQGKVYLTTQTWSYKAINMYLQFGFKPYLEAKPDGWKKIKKDFDTDNERAWGIIFDKLSM